MKCINYGCASFKNDTAAKEGSYLPTAIYCGLPVNTQYGFQEIDGLQKEILDAKYESSTLFIAWEHEFEETLAKQIVKQFGGNVSDVPKWDGNEYDMIYVFKIKTIQGKKKLTFTVEYEGLNNLKEVCPFR